MFRSLRSQQFARTEELCARRSTLQSGLKASPLLKEPTRNEAPRTEPLFLPVRQLLISAGCSWSPALFLVLWVACALAVGIVSLMFLSLSAAIAFICLALWIPWSMFERRAGRRASAFAEDYAVTLHAIASSLKAGLTPYLAVERSIRLLPAESIFKREVLELLRRLQSGIPRERCFEQFGSGIALPDLSLFRTAFLLALESGGRFSPALVRLADVSRQRQALIRAAQASTANMRMTANILVGLMPILLIVPAVRTPSYWQTLFHHPTANTIAGWGLAIVLGGYVSLRKLSDFRP